MESWSVYREEQCAASPVCAALPAVGAGGGRGSDEYQPYSYYNVDGSPQGVDVEMAREAFRRMGYAPVFRHVAWEDKDEALADGAVEKILSKWAEVKDKGYAGLVGLDADFTGNVIGKGFPVNMTETTISGYYAAGGAGDKKLVYRTDVINAYPEYPVFDGEKYVSLSYKYLLIDQDYKLAVLDDVLCNVEYQPDGSSNNMFRQYLKNPKGFAFWRTVKMQYPESFKRLVMDCIHYCSSSQIAGNRHYIKESPRKLLTVLCTPAGWALTAFINKKVGLLR